MNKYQHCSYIAV